MNVQQKYMMLNEIIESGHIEGTNIFDFSLILKQINMILRYEGKSNFNVKKALSTEKIKKHLKDYPASKCIGNSLTYDIVFLAVSSTFFELLQGSIAGADKGAHYIKNRALYDISPEAHEKLQEWIAANECATVDKIRKKELAFIETYT